jgi:hypothetical protein
MKMFVRGAIVIALVGGLVPACSDQTGVGLPPPPIEGENSAAPVPGTDEAPVVLPETYDPSQQPGIVKIEDKGIVLSAAIWSPAAIPVCWEDASDTFKTEQAWVKDAVTKSWQAHSQVSFEGWVKCGSAATGIRIAISEEGPHTKGLGNQLNGKKRGMVLNFRFTTWSPSCQKKRESCIRAIAVHEFGHALAFAHEHNREDTPGECTKPAQGTNGDRPLTPWDLKSVMNYCNPEYSNNGVLSDGDIISVRTVYGAR